MSPFGDPPEDAVDVCPVGFIDKTGVFKIRAVLESARDFREGLAAARLAGKWGFLDDEGNWAIEPRFEEAQSFREGLAAVRQNGLWGFVDETGELRIEPQFTWTSGFSDGVAVVLDREKESHYIDRNGAKTMVGDFRYRTPLVQGLAAVRLDAETVAYVNRAGEIVFVYEARRGE